VYYDGEAVWVPAQYLSLSDRPGIDLEEQAVTLTGASVDGFDVAAHGDSGGWIGKRELSQ
jgi:hypothetical protein